MTNYTKEQLVIEPFDVYCERMIEMHPENEKYFKTLRGKYKDFKEWDKENPAPVGYVNCFNPNRDY